MYGKTFVDYYLDEKGNNPVKDFIDDLSNKQKAKVFRIIETIEKYGLDTAIPHLKRLKGYPLWEIRILGRDNIRLFYVVRFSNTIILLHGFVKKTQKTPQKEISIAMKRFEILED